MIKEHSTHDNNNNREQHEPVNLESLIAKETLCITFLSMFLLVGIIFKQLNKKFGVQFLFIDPLFTLYIFYWYFVWLLCSFLEF